MSAKVIFDGKAPDDAALWEAIATAVLGRRDARVVARWTPEGWEVSLGRATDHAFATIAHPYADGDFESELRLALRAAGIPVKR